MFYKNIISYYQKDNMFLLMISYYLFDNMSSGFLKKILKGAETVGMESAPEGLIISTKLLSTLSQLAKYILSLMLYINHLKHVYFLHNQKSLY